MVVARTLRILGGAVRDARRDAGWTQQQLADRAGVTRQWVVQLEQGQANPTFENLRGVCETLNLIIHLHPGGVDPTGIGAVEPRGTDPAGIDLDEIIERHTRPPD